MGFIARAVIISALVSSLGWGIIGCEKEGPAERAGKQIDKTIKESGEKLEEAGERLKEKT